MSRASSYLGPYEWQASVAKWYQREALESSAVPVLGATNPPYTLLVNWAGHRILDKRTFIGMVEAGEPLIQQAVDAVREYHQAQGRGAPAEEVERLLAESLFQAVSDYQLRVVARARGKNLPPTH